jgi:hypothetical protein
VSLDLSENVALSDMQPLLDNTGLGSGDVVNVTDTAVSCDDVNSLRVKLMIVYSDCA